MHRLFVLLPLFALQACRNDGPKAAPEPRKISYSREVRPLLISNCLQCHADLPLDNPTSWDLLHSHPDQQVPGLVRDWVKAGSPMDTHWALTPLEEIEFATLDDFPGIGGEPLASPRQTPPVSFFGTVDEALAGDLLPKPDQAIYTGYFRQGEDTPVFRATKAAQEFLGLRLECAECHDHPHEPVTTADYQRLVGLFTTPFDDQRLPGELRPPLYVAINEASKSQRTEWLAELKQLLQPAPVDAAAYDDWLNNEGSLPKIEGLVAAYAFEKSQLTNLALESPVQEGGAELLSDTGVHGQGLTFENTGHLDLYGLGLTDETSPFSVSLWLKPTSESLDSSSLVTIGKIGRGFELRITGSKVQARWSRAWPQNAIAVTSAIPLLAPNRWAHLVVTSDGSRTHDGLRIYFNGRPAEVDTTGDGLIKSILDAEPVMSIHGNGVSLDELQVFQQSLTDIEAAQLFDGTSLAETFVEKGDLEEFFQKSIIGKSEAETIAIAELNRQILELENGVPEYLVMQESGDELPAPSANAGPIFKSENRLEFARTLNKNLLARSLANEIWRAHFGSPLAHGLGFGDSMPSQPELLEWLAGKLVEFNFRPQELAALIQSSNLWQREWQDSTGPQIECPRD